MIEHSLFLWPCSIAMWQITNVEVFNSSFSCDTCSIRCIQGPQSTILRWIRSVSSTWQGIKSTGEFVLNSNNIRKHVVNHHNWWVRRFLCYPSICDLPILSKRLFFQKVAWHYGSKPAGPRKLVLLLIIRIHHRNQSFGHLELWHVQTCFSRVTQISRPKICRS